VATTYWGELKDPKPLIPYIKSPYVVDPNLPVPDLVLTKTFCSSDCESCVPPILGLEEFRRGCRAFTVRRAGPTEQFERELFAENLIAKTVHYVRNPFDNIVDRMHSGINTRRNNATWTGEMISRFNDTRAGIMAWCEHLDGAFEGDFEVLLPGVPKELYANLPCKAEWFRYVYWHNRALESSKHFQVPTHVLYFEDFRKQYKRTVSSLLSFLELAQVREFFGAAGEFGETYTTLYDDELGRNATRFVRAIATPDCWQLLRHYFERWVPQPPEQGRSGGALIKELTNATR